MEMSDRVGENFLPKGLEKQYLRVPKCCLRHIETTQACSALRGPDLAQLDILVNPIKRTNSLLYPKSCNKFGPI